MIIKEERTNRIIEFEREDWTSGIAKEAISFFKQNKGRYQPNKKSWILNEENYMLFLEWKEGWEKKKNKTNVKLAIGAKPDIAIGIKNNGKVDINGLIGLYERINKISDFIEVLNETNADEDVIELYETNLEQMMKEFESIIHKRR